MWSSRLSLLVYLGMYKEAESELEEFGELDNPDLYYEHHTHSYPGRKGGGGLHVGACSCGGVLCVGVCPVWECNDFLLLNVILCLISNSILH